MTFLKNDFSDHQFKVQTPNMVSVLGQSVCGRRWGGSSTRRRLVNKLQMPTCTLCRNRLQRERRKQILSLSHFYLRTLQSFFREDKQLGEFELGDRAQDRDGKGQETRVTGMEGQKRGSRNVPVFPFCSHKTCSLLPDESIALLISRFRLVEAAVSNIGLFYIYRHHQSFDAFNLSGQCILSVISHERLKKKLTKLCQPLCRKGVDIL